MKPKRRVEAVMPKRRRKNRSRPIPTWLKTTSELDAIAQRRCLMILRVLSGEQPVTEAIAEAEITRPHYYLLERRAVEAMVRALIPGAESAESGALTTTGRIRELEEQVRRLEQDKRRSERLLFLTRKVMSGPMKLKKRGRPAKSSSEPGSTNTGKRASRGSLKKTRSKSANTDSTPMKVGEDERSSGNES
jgi:hypothetical protein